MDIRGWSDKREQNFLNWCDFCQLKIMKKRNITTFNNQEITIYNNQILNIIKKRNSILVMNLFESLPDNLLVNKNTKNELVKLAKEGHIKIGSNINSVNENEQEYYLEFQILKKESIQKEIIPSKFAKSNAEKVLDGQFKYDGPKHIFNNIERIEISQPVSYNSEISNIKEKEKPKANKNLINKLKNNLKIKQTTINLTEEIKTKDARKILSVRQIPIAVEKEKIEKLKIDDEKINEPIIEEKIIFKNEDAIDFINSLELIEKYYILEFLKIALKKEKEKLVIFNLQNEMIKNTDAQWEKERNNWRSAKPSAIKMFFYYLSYLLIIGIFIPNPIKKNPIKKRAKIIWKDNLKTSGNYENAKNKILAKYTKLNKFI